MPRTSFLKSLFMHDGSRQNTSYAPSAREGRNNDVLNQTMRRHGTA